MPEDQPEQVPPSADAPIEQPQTDEQPQPKPKPTETVDFWKDKARDWESRSKSNADKAKQFDALSEQSKSDLEKAQEAAQRESDRATSYRNRAVSAEARAAARDFIDPEVAVALLGDLGQYVDDDGDIDSTKLSSDIADMLAAKPYLARVQPPAGMKPNPAQSRGYSQPPTKAQEIQEAQSRGDRKKASILRADQLLMND